MGKYKFKATNLIAKEFDALGEDYYVEFAQGQEELMVTFPIRLSSNMILKFISRSDDNNVGVRIYGLISEIPSERRSRVLEACNVLHTKVRYVTFNVDRDGDLDLSMDFLSTTADDSIGKMALEAVERIKNILDNEYPIFMKAIYTDEPLDISERYLRREQVNVLLRDSLPNMKVH